jgi:multidrug efflux pump subunit AcrB
VPGFVRGFAIALVPLGVVGEEFIPATDRGQIYIQLTYPIGTPLTTSRGVFKLERVIDAERRRRRSDDRGRYSASFGGFVVAGQRRADHVFLKDAASTRPTIGSQLQEDAPKTSRRDQRRRPVDRHDRRQQAADRPLVSDVTGGDPTAPRRRSRRSLRARPARPASTARERARAAGLGRVRPGKAQALDVDLGGRERRRRGLRRRRRDPVRDAAGPRASAGHLPARKTSTQLVALARFRSAQNGSIVHLGDFATFARRRRRRS